MINIMNEYTAFTKRCLNSYMKFILDKQYDKGIVNRYIDKYIEIRYSNYLDENTIKDTLAKKITKGIKDTTIALEEKLPANKENIIKNTEKIFKYVNSLDSSYFLESHNKVIENIGIIRRDILELDNNNFSNALDKMLREESSNLLRVNVKDNIKFPELYSDIAIDKARHKDSISEDIITIGYILTTVEIINNLISNNFNNTYYLPLPTSIFNKTTKKNRLLSIIDNEYILEHISLVITFNAFQQNKSNVVELMHKGYMFTIALDKTFDYCSENLEYLEMFSNIFMLKDKYYYKDMLKNGKLGKRIIIVDEVE